MEPSSNGPHVKVELVKRKLGGLGFVLKKRPVSPHAVICDIVKGSIAEETGILKIGDILLEVNDEVLENRSYENALEVLGSIPVGGKAMLKVLAGNTDHREILETFIKEEGSTQTVRKEGRATTGNNTGGKQDVRSGDAGNKKASVEEAEKSQSNEVNGNGENEGLANGTSMQGNEQCCPEVLPKPLSHTPKYMKLQNLINGRYQIDNLHQNVITVRFEDVWVPLKLFS